MGSQNENWIDYNVGWTDGEWHHIAVTWSKSTGEVSLYLDGQKKTPFWVCNRGEDSIESQPGSGVHSNIATGTYEINLYSITPSRFANSASSRFFFFCFSWRRLVGHLIMGFPIQSLRPERRKVRPGQPGSSRPARHPDASKQASKQTSKEATRKKRARGFFFFAFPGADLWDI